MEIAIPAIALGALYIISNQEKCKSRDSFGVQPQDYPEPKNTSLHNDVNRYMVNLLECCRRPKEFHSFMCNIFSQDEQKIYLTL